MAARPRWDATMSAPGSPRIRASSAEASSTISLTLRLGATVGNQFVNERAVSRHETAPFLLDFAENLGLRQQHDAASVETHAHRSPVGEADSRPQLGRQHDTAAGRDPCAPFPHLRKPHGLLSLVIHRAFLYL